uniref:Uncharacterized protein n=1 Tax=Leersia perrieri TaxID=77586 RepID=A0A0D9VQD3_9ORYZ
MPTLIPTTTTAILLTLNARRSEFTETSGTQEGCTLRTQVANERTSRKLENLLASQVLLDNFTDEETKYQYVCNSGLQTAHGKSKKKSFMFLTKLQNRITSAWQSEASLFRNPFNNSPLSRDLVVRENAKLVSIIRRTAAICFSPSSVADEDYDYLPHMQLDKMTHVISREAFGPLYLVT